MSEELELAIKIPSVEGLPDPTAANWFQFSFVGPDVQMLIGYVDLHSIHVARDKAGAEVTPVVLHRLSLGSIGWGVLREQVKELDAQFEAMRANRAK